MRNLALRLLFHLQALLLIPLARLFWRIRITGRKFHRGTGGLIIAANHQSWLDAGLVQCAVYPHQITFLMTELYYDLPLLGLYFRAARARPIREEGRPSVAGMRAALAALEAGEMICLFPEGEITTTGRMRDKGQRGIARLARKTGAPVLPIGIRGAMEIWSKVQPRIRFSGSIELRIGEALRYEEGTTREDEERFTARLMDELRLLCAEEAEVTG